MLKLNKSIHFNILCIFAIVFVCVYLYYTITDVKKIAVEVKKHGQDITNIITSLATITKELGDLKKKAAVCSTSGVCKIAPVVTAQEVVEHEVQEDNESVNTDEVKNLLSDIPDDEGNVDDPQDVLEEELESTTVKDYKSMSVEELKLEKYDDIKEYCKTNSINAKGTKDVLIQRIKA